MNNFFQELPLQKICTINIFDNEYDCILNIDENKTIYIIREKKDNDSLWIKCYFSEVPETIFGKIKNKKFTLINTIWTTANDGEQRIIGNAIFINEHIDFDSLMINNFQFSLKNIGALFENDLYFALDDFDLQIKQYNEDAIIHIKNNVKQEFSKFDKIAYFMDLFFNTFSTSIITRKENFSFVYKNNKLEFMNTPKYLNNKLSNTKNFTITNRFLEEIVQTFYKQYKDFPIIYNILYNIQSNYPYLVLENKFLAFAQILEAIDRAECRQNTTYNSEYKIKKKEDCTFKNHLKYLFDIYDINILLNLEVTSIDVLQTDIKNVRHTLTHIEKGREYNTDNFKWIPEIMKFLIIYIFLKKLEIIKLSKNFNMEIDFYIQKYITK